MHVLSEHTPLQVRALNKFEAHQSVKKQVFLNFFFQIENYIVQNIFDKSKYQITIFF